MRRPGPRPQCRIARCVRRRIRQTGNGPTIRSNQAFDGRLREHFQSEVRPPHRHAPQESTTGPRHRAARNPDASPAFLPIAASSPHKSEASSRPSAPRRGCEKGPWRLPGRCGRRMPPCDRSASMPKSSASVRAKAVCPAPPVRTNVPSMSRKQMCMKPRVQESRARRRWSYQLFRNTACGLAHITPALSQA